MQGEFEKRIKTLELDKETEKKVLALFTEAGEEFGCLACPSKDDCENFKWYKKWFNF